MIGFLDSLTPARKEWFPQARTNMHSDVRCPVGSPDVEVVLTLKRSKRFSRIKWLGWVQP